MKSKVTFISDVTTPERVYLNVPEFKDFDLKFFTTLDGEEKITKEVPDTEFLIVDAMSKVTEKLVDSLPNLKLIQSEGVGFQGIDVDAAARRNIPVCNNKGINDTAVAEVAVFLILGCLKNYNDGITAMYDGKQIEKKAESFGVIRELSECTSGVLAAKLLTPSTSLAALRAIDAMTSSDITRLPILSTVLFSSTGHSSFCPIL